MNNNANSYWQANVRLIIKLLIIWFSVPFLAGIVFVDTFNQISLGGYPLGFWPQGLNGINFPSGMENLTAFIVFTCAEQREVSSKS